MTVTREQLLKLFVDSGVKREIVDGLDPREPLTGQGVDSVDYQAIMASIEEQLAIKISGETACTLKTLEDFERVLNNS